MEGWRPVEDLIRWGFGHAPVVMANEAHSGLARSVRTREVGVRMVRAAYEAVFEITADTDQDRLLSMEFTNWREREQAGNLGRLLTAGPGEPLLVWCGNGHATKEECGEWIPMGWHFRAMSGVDPFVIDQTVTVDFGDGPRPWVRELLASVGETLAAYGGTAGILRDQAPPPLDGRTGVDALVVSADNELTP